MENNNLNFNWMEREISRELDNKPEVVPSIRSSMEALPPIVAVDFDGTLVVDCFPQIGSPITENVVTLKSLKRAGVKVILWTSRDNNTDERNLDKAVAYCRDCLGVEFDAVNQNLPEVIELFHNDTRKIYANIYWDDKAVPHTQHPLYWAERIGLSYHSVFGLRNRVDHGY